MVYPRPNMKPLQIRGLFISAVLGLTVGITVLSGQSAGQIYELRLNEPIEREIKGGQTHEYHFVLKADEFIQVRVEKKGVDVFLSIHSADGEQLAVMRQPYSNEAVETLSFVAEKAGGYLIKIWRSKDDPASVNPGVYNISLREKRPAVASDQKRILAERELHYVFFNKILPMGDWNSMEEIQRGVEQGEGILSAWRELGDDDVVSLIERKIIKLKEIFKDKKLEAEQKTKRKAAAERRKEKERGGPGIPQMIVPTGHDSTINAITFSPDGKILATGSSLYENKVKLWDVATGQELRTFVGHTHHIESLAFSPDGKTLASGSYDATVQLWDVATGRDLKTIKGRTGYDVQSVAFSPDGKIPSQGLM
jgi:WD40 repeat protein